MNQIRIYTLRDGTERKIKIEEGMTFQEELKLSFITIKYTMLFTNLTT